LPGCRSGLEFKAGIDKEIGMAYRSKIAFLGLPIVDVAIGTAVDGKYKRRIARGWIAIGDVSFGVLVSIGGVAFGCIALGGMSVGLLAFAGLAIGAGALGGAAVGVWAIGGGAYALHAAVGGQAIAIAYAKGGQAIAKHTTDLAAQEFFSQSLFFRMGQAVMEHSQWFLLLLVVPVMVVLMQQRRAENR
jgi:hypothetical protein